MRLGLSLPNWRAGDQQELLALARHAEDLGFHIVWSVEAYGPDAVTTLSWIGATTSRIGLGTAVMQIPARTPAMTAMTANALDVLSGGRMNLGLGVSGPQVSEGWHGVPFAKPLARTREYVQAVRTALSGSPLTVDGDHHRLPLPGGAGKPLRLSLRPSGRQIPINLAAIGPRNTELVGEIADGWLAFLVAPESLGAGLESLAVGAERAGRDVAGIDVVASVPSVLGDPRETAQQLAPFLALYIGGMGSRQENFYTRQAGRLGFEDAAHAIQDAYLDGRHRDAAAAVPHELIDAISLLGDRARLAERIARFAAAGVTTLTVSPMGRTLADRLDTLTAIAGATADAGLLDPPPAEPTDGGA